MNYGVIIFSLSCMLFFGSYSGSKIKTPRQYLKETLTNLREIKSATYFSRREAWAPGDTVPSIVQFHYYKAYNNPIDTTLGASWVALEHKDTTKLKSAYDGHMYATVFEEEKGILIDSFKVRKLPFRPMSVPFYFYTRDILEYALTTTDSVSLDFNDLGDTVYVKLTIHEDRQVEFFGKAHYMPENPYSKMEPTSRYELWIDKSTKLPFRVRREMFHNISTETVSNAELNSLNMENFVAATYFPAAYEVRQYGEKRRTESPQELMGEKAPEWLLTNEYGEKEGLKELTSKVVMIQFTSVNCGPCRASIPFLKKLSSMYSKVKFDLVAIESFTSNTHVLTTYRKRNDFAYKFLMSEEEVNKAYNIRATPIFFILDENRIIREIIRGYGGASTDKEITEAINKLI